MARYTQRKLFLYTLHAHNAGTAIPDYRALFEGLGRLSVAQRSKTSPSKLVALRRLTLDGDFVRITAYEGPPGVEPLIFNLASDEERIEDLADREVLATRTHAVVNLKNRDVVVEYNHRGAKAFDIESILQSAARAHTKWRKLEVELSPVASPDFARSIDEFDAIKIATLNIVRPNLNWVREKNHADAIAAESDGGRVGVSVFAGRDQSLAKSRGMVALIKSLTRESKSNLKNASVVGRRSGEQSDTKISLEKHLEHRVARVELGRGGHPETRSVDARIDEFLVAREAALSRRGRNTVE